MKESITALVCAYARAYHAEHDNPKIFDDYLARKLFTDEEYKQIGVYQAEALKFYAPEVAATNPDQASAIVWVMQHQSAPITLSRSRYAEDTLEEAIAQGVRQYVILGAGFDTFAFRKPELLKQIDVFEVDHPATQAAKLQRLARLGWGIPQQLHFVPVDFVHENISDALARSSYNPHLLTLFSWLGVTYYLPHEAVMATLRALAHLAPCGSSIIFDYYDTDSLDSAKVARRFALMQEIVKRVGEPIKTAFDPSTLEADLQQAGLMLKENLSPADIEKRYFANRTDDYHAFEHVHFARAIVDR